MNDTTAQFLESYPPLNTPPIPPEIIHSLTERTIYHFIAGKINVLHHHNLDTLLEQIDQPTALQLVNTVLPSIKLLDPAVGSGAFLVAAFQILLNIYQTIHKKGFLEGLDTPFYLDSKKIHILTHNLHGVDILEEAIERTRSRLSLYLPATSSIPFNLIVGNSLFGQMRADSKAAEQKPLHWNRHFPEIMQDGGGFDIILTHPPKDKNSHSWITPWYKKSDHSLDYQHQTSPKINPPALFVERCFHLLRTGGQCGMLLPSGIYTDLGTKGVRDLLFEQTQIQGLFCFANGKALFEGVDNRFKLVVLNFTKGGANPPFSS